MRFRALVFVCLVVLAVWTLQAAAVNPTLKWRTLSTEHFDVHFHEGAEWTAQQVAEIAEEVYPAITGLYEYEPARCNFVILDTEDYANGAAYFYDNKIEIWATNLEFNLRGTSQWLRNVVTHEFTHIVSMQAAMKMPRRIPAIYFQAVGFEDEKRPDVLTGYPNAIASYPVVGAVVPPWWAEGVAQYQSPSIQYDCWDTHRDMIVRSAVIADALMSYDEIGYLGHKSIKNEQVYDHGYGLVRYIASTYGPESIDKISQALGKWYRLTIDGALEDVTGKSGEQIYDDWKQYLRIRYDKQLRGVRANPREGLILSDGGYMTIAPSLSPDGKRVAFLSNKGSDFAATSLYLVGADGEDLTQIQGGVSSRGVFSPDGARLLYAKHVRADKYGAKLSDLYVYDLATEKEKRLTHRQRAAEPQYAPDGESLVCVLNSDGTHRIAVADADGNDLRTLFKGEKGTQFYAPQFAPDGKRILFGVYEGRTRDIASVAVDGSDFRYELQTVNDERDARWTPDGGAIVFASDRSGIFNIYRLDLATRDVEQLTNVTGGAFMPDASAVDGSVAYSGYNAGGYHVAILDGAAAVVEHLDASAYATRTAGEFDECAGIRPAPAADAEPTFDEASLTTDAAAPATTTLEASGSSGTGATGTLEPRDYKNTYTSWQLYPRVLIWDGTPRFGAFVASNEILDRQNFFFGGSYGTNGEFDFYINFELRKLFPVLYLEYFRVRQKNKEITPVDDLLYFLDVRYDLWAIDAGLRFEFEDIYNPYSRNDISLWYDRSEYNVFIDPEYQDVDGVIRPDFDVGWKYFVGNEFNLRWYFKHVQPRVDSDINPRGGREISLRAMYAIDELFTSGEFEYAFRPAFDTYSFGQYWVDWREYLALPGWRHSLQLRFNGSIIDKSVDDFFWYYLGGMDGIRGYTYYSIGGRRGAMANATYRFPIWRRINRQLSWLTFKDIYGGVFYEAARVWDSLPDIEGKTFSSVGYELRFNLGSFYMYPTTVGLTGARSLDTATFFNPVFDVPPVVHEPQWRYYFTLGFTF